MVEVYFSGATAPTCLYTVPTLTDAEATRHVFDANFGVFEQPHGSAACRGRAEPAMRSGAERSTSAENQTDPLPGFDTN